MIGETGVLTERKDTATPPHRPAVAVVWNGLGIGGRHIIQFAATMVLARALSPQDFGAVSMIVVLTAFAATCADLGLGVTLVQHPGITRRQLDAAFWLAAGTGVLLTITLWVLAPVIAAFYERPGLASLTRAIALQFTLNGLSVVPRALLVRGVQFRRLAVIELSTGIVSAAGGITLALSNAGVWALVGQLLIAAGMSALMCFVFARWRPHSVVGPRVLTDMASFSGNLLSFRAVNYWARNADTLLIGRVLGAAPLGLYALAYGLVLLPLQQVTTIIGDVMMPVMASRRDDLAQVRLAFMRAVQAVALALFPVMIGMVIVAGEAVPVLFGDNWLSAVPVARILAVAGCFQALGVTVGWIYQSQGRSDIMFRWGLFAAVIAVIGIAAGLSAGVVGVAAGYTIAVMLLTPLSQFIACRLIQLSARELLTSVRPALIATTFMAILALGARIGMVNAGLPNTVVLAGTIITGVAAYTVAVGFLRPLSLDLLSTFLRWGRPRRADATAGTWRVR